MAQKKSFKITTPRGCIYTSKNKNGVVTAKMKWNSGFVPKKKADFSKAQEFVDSECIRYMNPLTPRLTGVLIKSATIGTFIGSGEIEYLAPYGRRQYYEHKEKSRWFETMKAQRKETIMKGAERFAGGG